MNTIQLMWLRFEQCLGTFTMLLVEGSSETGLFRRLSDYVFGIRNFESTKSMRVNLYSKILKFNVYFKNSAKNWEKLFCFSDNCIWIGNIKLFLLTTGHYSSVANMLTSSPKIWDVNKRDFFEHYFLASDQSRWYKWRDVDLKIASALLPCCFSKGHLKRDFLEIYLSTFSESVILETQKLWGSSLFPKYSKFNLDFKIAAKNTVKTFLAEITPSELVSLNCLY